MKKWIIFSIVLISMMVITMSFALNGEDRFYRNSIVLDLTDKKCDEKFVEKSKVAIKEIHQFLLPASVAIIGDEAFEGTAIFNVELPATVIAIGEKAFANITTLKSIHIPIATKCIATTAFAGSNNITIKAAPNSYARSYAYNLGLPFSVMATFCASTPSILTTTVVHIPSIETIEGDNIDNQIMINQWHKLEEIKVIGTLEIIYNSILGRAPPMA